MCKIPEMSNKNSPEDRYQIFIEQSTEGIWRFEVEKPISVALNVSEQIDLFFEYAYLAECNDAMAQMYGLSSADELIGARLNQFFPRDKNTEDYLTLFITSGYKVQDALVNFPFMHFSMPGLITIFQ